jgi:hypothetical protein
MSLPPTNWTTLPVDRCPSPSSSALIANFWLLSATCASLFSGLAENTAAPDMENAATFSSVITTDDNSICTMVNYHIHDDKAEFGAVCEAEGVPFEDLPPEEFTDDRGRRLSFADILRSGLLFGSEYLTHGRDQRLRSERFLK